MTTAQAVSWFTLRATIAEVASGVRSVSTLTDVTTRAAAPTVIIYPLMVTKGSRMINASLQPLFLVQALHRRFDVSPRSTSQVPLKQWGYSPYKLE
jgi:hypothetical protein